MYENKLFSACFIVWMYRYTTFEIKVDLCAHTYGKIGTFTAEYIPPPFWLVPPPPFPQVDGGGCYREKFFIFFLIFVWILVSTLFFRLSYLIISTRLKFVILYSILFFRLSIVSTRYKLSLDIHHLFRFIFITFGFLDFRH